MARSCPRHPTSPTAFVSTIVSAFVSAFVSVFVSAIVSHDRLRSDAGVRVLGRDELDNDVGVGRDAVPERRRDNVLHDAHGDGGQRRGKALDRARPPRYSLSRIAHMRPNARRARRALD